MGKGWTPAGGPGLPCGRCPRCRATAAAGRIASRRTKKKVAFLIVFIIEVTLRILDWKSCLMFVCRLLVSGARAREDANHGVVTLVASVLKNRFRALSH